MTKIQRPNKTEELLNTFRGLIVQFEIQLYVDSSKSLWPLGPIAVDVEHNEEGNLVGIGVCHEQSCFYFTQVTPALCTFLANAQLICHNGVSDIECLRQWGIPVSDSQLIHDTFLIGHIIDSSHRKYGLKDMAEREFGIIYPSYDDIVGKKTLKQVSPRTTLDKQPVELVAMYNAMDTFCTYKLYEKQKLVVQFGNTSYTYFANIEKPVSKVFASMSNRGVRVDLDYLRILQTTLEDQKRPIEENIQNELGPINLNSPKQLREALNEKDIFPTLKGKPSTDKRALEKFRDTPVISNLLAFSELDTLLSSFVRPYLERGQEVVHPFFNQCGTRTGRLSCSNPNLLQIPRRTENGKLVRQMFIARDGMSLGDCDYSAIEPRVLAHLSKDPDLCQLFNDGTDFHQFTADKLGISRDRAKILNLSVGYRATFKSVRSQLKCTDTEAQNEIDKWWALFPTLRRWQDALIYQSKNSEYCTTLLGRRLRIDGLSDSDKEKREAAERQLINNITQGSAAEIMKMAMIKIDTDLKDIGLLVQIYDELLFEEDEYYMEDTLSLIINRMENAVTLEVPLVVACGTGANWAEAH